MSWNIDPAHSEIQFSVRHMMLSKVRGQFDRFHGSINFDEFDPENSTVEVEIEAASINTGEPQRDAHLRAADFLNADEYPALKFKSTRIELLKGNRARLFGDLTIRYVPREVVLDVEYRGQHKSPYGTINAGFSAATRISRKDWGLTWNVALETGGVLVSDEIDISIEVELVRQPEAELQAVA